MSEMIEQALVHRCSLGNWRIRISAKTRQEAVGPSAFIEELRSVSNGTSGL